MIAIAPLGTIVACGSSSGSDETSSGITFDDSDYITATQTTSYADGVSKLLAGNLDFVGGYIDVRTTVSNTDRFTQGKIVGMTSYRISNDGIQARGNMTAGDQYVVQQLFQKMIRESVTNAELQIQVGGTLKSLFSVYSHSDYTPLSSTTEVAYMDSGTLGKKKAMGTIAPAPTGNTEIFKNTTGAIADEDYSKFATSTNKTLKINFIPSNDPTLAQAASAKLQAFLRSKSIECTVITSSDYSAAATSLNSNTIDLAFLPVNTWATVAPNSNFILQAGRPALVATMSVSGSTATLPTANITDQKTAVLATNDFGQLQIQQLPATAAELTTEWAEADTTGRRVKFKTAYETTTNPLHTFAKAVMNYRIANTNTSDAAKYVAGAYEAAIYSKDGNVFGDKVYNKLMDTGNAFELKVSDLLSGSRKASYGFTSTTSSASYVFPELWFNTHFKK